MTDEELNRFKERVEHWKQVYGLSEYNIFVIPDDELAGNVSAAMQTRSEYLRGELHVGTALPEEGVDSIDECLSHEVAHLFLAELAQWAKTILDYVGAGERVALNDAWHLAWERTTERLARLARKLPDE